MPLLFTILRQGSFEISFQIIYLSMNASDQGQVASFIHAYIEGRKMIDLCILISSTVKYFLLVLCFFIYIFGVGYDSYQIDNLLANVQNMQPKIHSAYIARPLIAEAPLNKIKIHILTNLNVWPTYIVILLITDENLSFKWGMIFVCSFWKINCSVLLLSMCLSVWLLLLYWLLFSR